MAIMAVPASCDLTIRSAFEFPPLLAHHLSINFPRCDSEALKSLDSGNEETEAHLADAQAGA
jgi:hypothetical protein